MTSPFLAHFSTGAMASDDLEATFVQREELLRRTLDLIRESATTPNKHHTLLIGPRGIGKTHLLALVYHRARRLSDLHGRLLIARLREDDWRLNSFLELLVRVLQALGDEQPGLVDPAALAALETTPPAAAEALAVTMLTELIGDRTLLVLIENLDEVFAAIGERGQQKLRAYIQEHPSWAIVATAQGLFKGVSLRTSPFYGFFRIVHLQALSPSQATELLATLAAAGGDERLADFLRTASGRARARAVHHLAAGNHRIIAIVARCLSAESVDELVEPLLRTLDELTPYYQARMRWLSAQQRKIVALLGDAGGALPVKTIARRGFMSHQTTSSQLKDLRDKSYVIAVAVGRESHYELHEPLLRLWLDLQRHGDAPVRVLVGLLRRWYTVEEFCQQLGGLAADSEPLADLRACLLDYHALTDTLAAAAPLDLVIRRDEALARVIEHGRRSLRDGRASAPSLSRRLTDLMAILTQYDAEDLLPTIMLDALADRWERDGEPSRHRLAALRQAAQEVFGGRPDDRLLLGLVDAAAAFRETGDRRALLALPPEYRSLVERACGE